MAWPFDVLTVTIANGASLSSAANLGGKVLVGIAMPSGWTAADLTFQVSQDGETFRDLYAADGTEASIEAAASRHIGISTDDFAGAQFVKLRSGASGGAVNQGGARSIELIARNVI